MKKLLILLLTFSMVFAMAGCGSMPDEVGEGESPDIAVCVAPEPRSIDPALNITVDGAIMLHHFFEGLVKWTDGGNGTAVLVPGMAESWDVSDNGLIYTFHLRKDALWSDGEPVTAYDFEYAWKRLVDPAREAGYNYILDCVLNGPEIIYEGTKDPSELAAVALDDYTFEVTLHTAIPYFKEITAFPATFPTRQDIAEKYGDQWTFDADTYVCNGPYKMKDWVHNSYIIMVSNPNYYDKEKPGPDSIKFALMDDNDAILNAFNSKELDFIVNVPVDQTPDLLESGKLQVADHIGTYFVSFQTQQDPFDDPRIREAFSLAIDRRQIVDQITKTGETPADGYVPSGVYDVDGPGSDFREAGGSYYMTAPVYYRSNCEKARELMDEAGYPNGSGFPTVEYLLNTDERNKAIGEALRSMWQTELGVTVTLKVQEPVDYYDTINNGDYSIASNGWLADYNDPISFMDLWVTGSGNNIAQYENPDYDALIIQAKTSDDQEVRMRAMHDAEDILMNEHVIAPIFFNTRAYMIADDLKGVYYSPLGYFIFSHSYR